MRWSLDAWNAVTKETISNCFRVAGFAGQDESPDIDQDSVDCSDLTTATDSVLVSLLPAGVTFSDFVSVDDELATRETEFNTDVNAAEESADKEEDAIEPPPLTAEALAAFRVLIRFKDHESVVRQSVMDEMERSLVLHSMSTKVQRKITDYFPSVSQ